MVRRWECSSSACPCQAAQREVEYPWISDILGKGDGLSDAQSTSPDPQFSLTPNQQHFHNFHLKPNQVPKPRNK